MKILIRALLLASIFNVNDVWATPDFEQQVSQLEKKVVSAPFLLPQLDFSDWLQEAQSLPLVSEENVKHWQSQLASLQPKTACEKIRYLNIQLRLTLLLNRTQLLASSTQNIRYTGVMSDLPNGKSWYLHWLNSWLQMELDKSITREHVKQLKQIAKQELNLVYPSYKTLQLAAPNKGMSEYSRSQGREINRVLRQREALVSNRLVQVFGKLPSIDKVKISKSSLPKSFPAPGIYNNINQTFYYHFTDNKLQEESLDWLYLHEATPGHHMQFSVSQTAPYCPASILEPSTAVTAEGWAAYVETLGKELGLYQQPASQAYTYQWRVLRALRVLIDIGVHFEGWSDQQALSLWQQYLPQHMTIAKRELARIKRWPVQVITYVYGKYRIEQILNELKQKKIKPSEGAALQKAHIRNTILRLSNQPLLPIQIVSHFLNDQEPQQGKSTL